MEVFSNSEMWNTGIQMKPAASTKKPSYLFARLLLTITLILLPAAAVLGQDASTATPTGPDTDRAALVALYNATNGHNWSSNTNWLSDEPIGDWHGVSTNGDGRVSRLVLGGNNLTGALPAELGDLIQIRYLLIGDNSLSGPIPPELGKLTQLLILTADYNQLSGPVPAELGNLNNLVLLNLSDNALTCIPPALEELAAAAVWGFFWDNDVVTCAEEAPTPTNTSAPTNTSEPTHTNTPTLTPTVVGTGATITVNSTCSLDDAIHAANTDTASGGCPAGSGDDTISLATNVNLNIVSPRDALRRSYLTDIKSAITIEGNGYTISGHGTGFGTSSGHKFFYMFPGSSLTLNNLAIRNGRQVVSNSGGKLSITNSTIENIRVDTAIESGNYSYVGRRFIATLTISNTTIRNVQTTPGTDRQGGAAIGVGPGIVRISNSVISNNAVRYYDRAYGGGLFINGATISINNTTISGNSAGPAVTGYGSSGGGIYVRAGTVTISNSTISGNSATPGRGNGVGGGIWIEGGSVTISNSTISNNSASKYGGGIRVSNGNLTLKHVTMANNSAESGAGLSIRQSSDFEPSAARISVADYDANVTLVNSIIAHSLRSEDCAGSLDTNTNNLIEDNSCSPALSGNPQLGTLTGSPAYYPLLDISLAINAADSAHCPSTDQAGQSRPVGNSCDIGAFESRLLERVEPTVPTETPTSTPTFTPTPTNTPTLTPTVAGTGSTITVNSTCSLDDAIHAANTDTASGGCPAGSGDDTISLATNVNLNIVSPRDALRRSYLTDIKSAITIEGNGYTISGHGTGFGTSSGHKFFYMFPGSSLTLNNLAIRNGRQVVSNSGGKLSITNSTIENIRVDTAIESGNYSYVGRRFIATLTISNTTIRNVQTTPGTDRQGGAAIGVGPGIVRISNSVISNNAVRYYDRAYGGGLFINGATISINNTTISGNSAGPAVTGYGSSGGGIYVRAGTVTISNSTISGNSATPGRGNGVGGGIWIEGGSVTISNSTISNNSASKYGGGIRVSNGNLTLKHVTMANNSAESGAGLSIRQSSDFEPSAARISVADYDANVTLVNSIIAHSLRSEDCAGSLDTNTNNLIEDNSCSPALSGNPQLGTLTGSPAYYPLLDISLAINAADSAHCPSTDQAGQSRPVGNSCDIGAFESRLLERVEPTVPTETPTSTPTFTPTPTNTPTLTPTVAGTGSTITVNSTCSLDDAIHAANTDTASGGCPAGSGDDTISLATNVNLNTVSPRDALRRSYLTDIKSAITIEGNGYTISGHGTGFGSGRGHEFFYMFPGSTLRLNNVTIRNGAEAVDNNGGKLSITNSTIENIWEGTAIRSGNYSYVGRKFIATLTISNTTIRNVRSVIASSIQRGGAIFAVSGNVSISNSTISNNSVSRYVRAYGGGLVIRGATVTISNTTISGNSALTGYGSSGGGIYVQGGTTTISNSTISGNSATPAGGNGVGGGIWIEGGSVTISNSTISNNSADKHGGGIRVSNGNLTLKHVTLANNSAESGAGLSIRQSSDYEPNAVNHSVADYDANVTLVNSIIAHSLRSEDCAGSLDTNTNNLIEDNSCSPALSGNPQLGTLTGSPAYHPLLPGSPAINAAHADHCPSTDQAGNSRPYPDDGKCDIGSLESRSSPPTATAIPTNTDTATATATITATASATDRAAAVSSPTAIPTLSNLCIAGDANGTDQVFTHTKYLRFPATYIELQNDPENGRFWWPGRAERPFEQFVGPNPGDLSRNRSWHNVWEHIYTLAGQNTAVNLRLRDNSVWLGGYTSLQDALNFLQLVVDEDTFDGGVNDYYYGFKYDVAKENVFGVRKIVTFTPSAVRCTNTPTATAPPTDTPTFTATPSPTLALGPGAATDRAALVALYNATYGDNWTTNTNWLSNAPLGNWFGVTTNSDGRVTAVKLHDNLLGGTLPNEIGNLSELRTLNLERNRHKGEVGEGDQSGIPVGIGNGAGDGWKGGLGGAIPSSLGRLSNLQSLDLGTNFFTGSIPTSLGNLGNLTFLDLSWNALSGAIPPALGNLRSLQTLWLLNNDLSGSIPSALAQLGRLENFSVGHNELTGSIPAQMGNLTTLVDFYVDDNALSGSIPATLGNLTNLQRFNLEHNALTGSIPPELGNLRNAWLFYLAHNQLTGEIPSSLANLTSVTNLRLSYNNLTGCVPSVWRRFEQPDAEENTRFYLKKLNLPYCDEITDTPSPTMTNTATATDTASPTSTPTSTATATATDMATSTATLDRDLTCVNLQDSSYFLFPQSNYLSGSIDLYTDNECRIFHSATNYGGNHGIAYATDAQAAAEICTSGNDDAQQYSATILSGHQSIWLCQLSPTVPPPPTDTLVPQTDTPVPPTNTSVPTNTPPPPPTNTPEPVVNSRDVVNVHLSSNQPGDLIVSWDAPSDPPRDYRVMYARVDENYKSWRDSSGNAYPTGTSITLTGLDQGVQYKVKVRARYNGSSGPFTEQIEALVMDATAEEVISLQQQVVQEPTDTPVPPTSTLVPSTNTSVPTNTALPPTDIPLPTNTPIPPTSTPVPTDTPVPPTNTLVPTDTPIPPTNTPVPTDTPIPPTHTPVPTNTPPPTNTSVPVILSRDVTNVHLTSNQLGTLTVTWTAPTDPPHDYRVMYARVDEDYKTWRDSSGNAYPTSTSITLTGLDQGVRYKVKVRARYSGSSGPFTEQVEIDIASS